MTKAPVPDASPEDSPELGNPDDAYANAPYIDGAETFLETWPERAAAWRSTLAAAGRMRAGVAHGPGAREQADVFHPEGSPAGIAVIVHGGYWMRFDRSTFSHLARGAVERGWIVVMPSYPLCPEASIGEIGESAARAVAMSARLDDALPLALAGHSAGGQIVTRMLCDDGPLDARARARLHGVLSISGVHDLVPLLATSMNETLGLDEADAIAWSPARSVPWAMRPAGGAGAGAGGRGVRVIARVGANERPEFLRQNRLLGDSWSRHGVTVDTHVEPGRHHFDVIEALEDVGSDMLARWLDDRPFTVGGSSIA